MNAKQLINAALWVVLVMLGVANVLLVRQNLEATRPNELHAGEKVQPFLRSTSKIQETTVSPTRASATLGWLRP
jgi:cytoskeletal protein RodZ